MSSGQQIIKALAIAFAIFIIINIFGWALFGISTFLSFSKIGNEYQDIKTTKDFSEVYSSSIQNVKIQTAISKLTIKEGTQFKVEGQNLPSRFSAKAKGFNLTVKEEGNKNLFGNNIASEIIITIPKGKTLSKLEIETGVGTNVIQDITVNNLDLECGVGTMEANNLIVDMKAKIKGGAGKTVIKESKLHNLDLESGVGEMSISADITGNSKAECGVGRTQLDLLRKQEDYQIIVQTGIGRMALNGEKCSKNYTYGTGKHHLRVDGGVGNVDITTLKEGI